LLIPVRIVVAVPLITAFLLILNALKTLIGLSGFILFYGLLWLLDRFVWPGLLNMPDGLFILPVILTYVLLFYVVRRISDSSTPIKTKLPTPNKKGAYDALFDFVFEAKYIEPAIEIYGPNFQKPTFEEYGLQAEEYYAYNRRFSLSGFEFPITVFSGIIAGYLASSRVTAPTHIYVAVGVAIIACLVVVSAEQINSRKYAQYHRVKNYDRAKKIYDSIEEQVRKERFRLRRNA
jgi:hypothetical protein